MKAIELSLIPHQSVDGIPYQHLHISLTTEDGIIQPINLKGLQLPDSLNWQQGVVLEGKAPIWLYGYLVHECHPAVWVACYDTRLGAVVIATRAPNPKVGQVLPIQLPDTAFRRS